MAERSAIEWTNATWNPITGCSLVSEGCRHCYAATLAATRLKGHPSRAGLARLNAAGEAKFTGEVRFNEQWLDQPLRWRRPRMIFVCAHGDLFHEAVPDGWIMRVFMRIWQCPQHVFQVLTKRPERMRDFMQRWGDLAGEDLGDFKGARGPEAVRKAHPSGRGQLFAAMLEAMGDPPPGAAYPLFDWMHGMIGWPNWPANLWLGTSCEDQATADERIPPLLATPAAVRFISAEPLLGPIDLCAAGAIFDRWSDWTESRHTRAFIDWVIAGGESGRGARPMHPDWPRTLRDQCQAAGVAFHFKQWGEWAWEPRVSHAHGCFVDDQFRTTIPWNPGGIHNARCMARVGKKRAGRLLDGREHNEFPGVV